MLGTSSLYTSPEWNDVLGAADKLWLFVVVSEVVGATPVLFVQIETSANDVDWANLNTNPEINRVTITGGARTVIRADAITNACGLARLRVALGASDDQARVQVWVTGRDNV